MSEVSSRATPQRDLAPADNDIVSCPKLTWVENLPDTCRYVDEKRHRISPRQKGETRGKTCPLHLLALEWSNHLSRSCKQGANRGGRDADRRPAMPCAPLCTAGWGICSGPAAGSCTPRPLGRVNGVEVPPMSSSLAGRLFPPSLPLSDLPVQLSQLFLCQNPVCFRSCLIISDATFL